MPRERFGRDILSEPEYRVEGPLKVTGQARYTSDVQLPGMLCARFLMSPFAHARIVSIDAAAARALPGVHAVLTGADIGPRRFGRLLFDWPVLAHERVLFIGERVAAVAAETREIAEAAVKLIEVEYEELPAVLSPEAALAPDAPVLHPRGATYHALIERPPVPHPNMQGHCLVQKGDPDLERVFREAYRVFEDAYTSPRQHQGYIEPHACVVAIDPDGTVRVNSTNKAPFALRTQMAIVTGLPPEQIVVDSMFIGGDFGGKGLSIDEFACYYLAKAAGRPVKAVMTYVDELLAGNPRHPTRCTLRTGVTRDGRIIAHEWRAVYDGGAYQAPKPMPWPGDTWSALQAYNIPNALQEQTVVYTTTTPGGHVRAPGAAQMSLAGEGHIDHIARELGMDPLHFRLLNALRPGDSGPAGELYRNPRAIEVLETLRRETGWDEKKPRAPHRGRGIALRHREVGLGKSSVLMRLLPNGDIEVLYGTPDQGSGSQTVVRRVAASVLSIAPERIQVRYGTTAEAPPDPGAGASRVTHVIGQAALAGAGILKERLEELAAEVLGWPGGKVELRDDRFVNVENPDESVSFEEAVQQITRGAPVEVRGAYDSGHGIPALPTIGEEDDYNFYGYMIEVEVDPETGRVHPIEVVATVDVGTIINPTAHQGQVEGSFIFGFGNAVMEELVVEDGKITNLNLGEYKLPTQMDVPPLRTVLVPTDIGPGPFGAKAVGEITNAGVVAALANAVYDAVGVRIMTMPITAERVYQALEEKRIREG